MGSIGRRELQENSNLVKTELVAKRGMVIEELKNDTKTLFNNIGDSEIERMFEELSNYEDESVEFESKKYSIGAWVDERIK